MLRWEPRSTSEAVGNVVVTGAFTLAWAALVFYLDAVLVREWLWPGSTPPQRGAAEFLADSHTWRGLAGALAAGVAMHAGVLMGAFLLYQSWESMARFRRGRRQSDNT